MYWNFRTSLTIIVFLFEVASSYSDMKMNSTEDLATRVFSRRKRYLVFPEGSSLQLIFCNQITAIIPIGDIFLFGDTLALAWPLPKDPDLLSMFKDDYKAERREDLHEIYYLDEKGRVIAKVPYKRKTIINPAFAKRSVEDQSTSFKEKLRQKIDRKKMHDSQKNREYIDQKYMDHKSINFHRSSRFGLYEKLEKLFTAAGRDGRACLLYKLCEAKKPADQGTFLQELARVLFTIPKDTTYEKDEHKDYEKAHHDSTDDCWKLYPGCEDLEFSDKII